MKRWIAAAALLVLSLALAAPADAQTPIRTVRQPVGSLFRLSVRGAVDPADTFWVAYGPLAGKWGIVQLHSAGNGLYVAHVTLPAGRSVFSFIQGRGVMHTRLGAVPGNPVTTIRQIGPMSVPRGAFPLVVWQEPMG